MTFNDWRQLNDHLRANGYQLLRQQAGGHVKYMASTRRDMENVYGVSARERVELIDDLNFDLELAMAADAVNKLEDTLKGII